MREKMKNVCGVGIAVADVLVMVEYIPFTIHTSLLVEVTLPFQFIVSGGVFCLKMFKDVMCSEMFKDVQRCSMMSYDVL